MNSNPITKTIEEDCQNVIKELSTNTDKLLMHKKLLEDMQSKSKSSPQIVKNELSDLERDYSARVEKRNQLIPDMVKVREFYKKKEQFEKLKMEVPGEIMNQLVETVINVKAEIYRLDREMEEIKDDFDIVYKGGAAPGNNKSTYEPNQSFTKAGMSVLSGHTGAREVSRPNLLRSGGGNTMDSDKDPRFDNAQNLSMLNTNKNPRQFTDYLDNYQTELSKSLLLMDPSSHEFKKRMEELTQISQMKNSFAEFDAKEQLLKKRGNEEAQRIRANKMAQYGQYAGNPNLKLINDKTMTQVDQNQEANENIIKLHTQLARVNETVRGMEDLVREKERQAAMQRQKYEMLERERHLVDIERIRGDREQAEADHMKKLQRMNVELDYVEQMKLKTMNILSGQLESFTSMQEDRWKKRQETEKQYQQQKAMDMQKEFTLREKKRQAQFDAYMLALEEKMGMTLKYLDKDKNQDRFKDVNAHVGNKELMEMFGVGEDFHDQQFKNVTIGMGSGQEDLQRMLQNMDNNKGADNNQQGTMKQMMSRPQINFSTKSRRSSQMSTSSRISDKEQDPKFAFLYITKMKYMLENASHLMISFALLNSMGEPVLDLGDHFSKYDSDSMNPSFKSKLKIPLNLLQNDTCYLYGEIKTIDDGVSELPVVIFGNMFFKLEQNSLSVEVPIFFDSFSESALQEYLDGVLEQHMGTSMQLTLGIGSVNKSTKYELDSRLNTPDQQRVRMLLRKRTPEMVLEKIKYISKELYPSVSMQDTETLVRITEDRLLSDKHSVRWMVQRYFVPTDVLQSSISVEVIGFINNSRQGRNSSDPEIRFCRVLINPDSQGKNRKIHHVKDLNFQTKLNVQLMNKNKLRLDSGDLVDDSSCVFEVSRVVLRDNKVVVENLGFSLIPVVDIQGNLTFGIYVLPIFSPDLNWDTLDHFARINSWDLMQNLYTDKQIQTADRYIIVKLSDDIRSGLYKNNTRFDKYNFDFLTHDKQGIKNDPEFLHNLIDSSPDYEKSVFSNIK